jgi:hypothetical protein
MGVSAPPAGSAKDNVIFREPSSYEAMLRAELGAHERERALDLANRMEARMCTLFFPPPLPSLLGPPSVSHYHHRSFADDCFSVGLCLVGADPLSVTSRIRSILGEYEAEQPSSKSTSP